MIVPHPRPTRSPQGKTAVVLALVLIAVVTLGGHARGRSSTIIAHTIVVGRLPDALALDALAGRAIVANDADATVSLLDLAAGRVLRTVAVGSPGALAPSRWPSIRARTISL